MFRTRLLVHALGAAALTLALPSHAAGALDGASLAWTHAHQSAGFLSEIVSFDAASKTLWVSGVSGVDVLDARTGSLIQHIDTSAWGSINSVSISQGIAAFAIENGSDRTLPGVVKLFDTRSRSLLAGVNSIRVGALPDMLTFSADGSRLLVANEGTPNVYGARLADSDGHRNYGPGANDPVGSVSVIDMATRSVIATPTLAGVAQSGSHIRQNSGMDFEPEYIVINSAGTRAYVALQEANAMGVLNLQTLSFDKVIGLGAKDFSAAGMRIDPLNNGTAALVSVNAKGLYMPDGMALYEKNGQSFVLMANEGDFREDDADRSAASSFGASGLMANLRVSNTDSSSGDLYAAGARSFSIRDENGQIVYDSGEILDREAIAAGLYDDGRSRDKGVEPESVELAEIGGRTYAFVGLERTSSAAIAIFDISDPANTSFVRLLVGTGERSPEGLKAYTLDGWHYLAYSNEVSNTTSVFALAPVPEPASYGLMALGLLGVAAAARRRRQAA